MVGSQAILGTYDESQLPAAATMSIEVDILPIADTNEETARLADLIEGVAGELSPFEELHGYSIDGVDLTTALLPAGWRDRLVKVQNANTAGPSGSASVHRLVPEQGRPLRRQARCLPREGPQLRRRPARRRHGESRPHRRPATDSPARTRSRDPAGTDLARLRPLTSPSRRHSNQSTTGRTPCSACRRPTTGSACGDDRAPAAGLDFGAVERRGWFDKWGSEAPGHVCSEKPVPSEVVMREAAGGWSRSRVVHVTSAWRHPDALPVRVAQGCHRASTRPLS